MESKRPATDDSPSSTHKGISRFTSKEKKLINSIASSLETDVPQTLGDLYRGNNGYPWTDFLTAVNFLISEGLIEGKGDGFVVHYSLTTKGKSELKTHR